MKYIIDIEDEPMIANDLWKNEVDELYKAKGFNSLVFDKNGLNKLTPYEEPDREAIEEEVWKFIKYVNEKIPLTDYKNIYGMAGATEGCKSYREAKAKYDKWKAEKETVRIDDEIISDDGVKAVVININEWGDWRCLNSDGDFAVCTTNKQHWKKTGRHFDAVEKLLEQMK